jgi:hypothetical protein
VYFLIESQVYSYSRHFQVLSEVNFDECRGPSYSAHMYTLPQFFVKEKLCRLETSHEITTYFLQGSGHVAQTLPLFDSPLKAFNTFSTDVASSAPDRATHTDMGSSTKQAPRTYHWSNISFSAIVHIMV